MGLVLGSNAVNADASSTCQEKNGTSGTCGESSGVKRMVSVDVCATAQSNNHNSRQ